MKVTLLNDTDGRENIGCRLTSTTLKRQLAEGLQAASDPVELDPFPWFFSRGANTGRAWMAGLTWMRAGYSQAQADRFTAWLQRLAEQEYGITAVETALASDLVVCQPEGSISDYHDAVRIMNLLCLPLLACVKQIPVFTMNGTFPLYPQDDRRFRMIHGFLQACRFAALRDRITADHYGVTFMPDSAIMQPVSAVSDRPADRPYVLMTTGAHQSKATNLAMAREALRFCDVNARQPLILTKKHKDLRVLEPAVRERGGRLIEQATLAEAESWLGQCAMHIGGRYHMALFGLLLDVPSVLIPVNTHKNRWLAEEFAGIELVGSPTDIVPAATRLYRDCAHPAAMRQGVQAARQRFRDGLQQAAGVARCLPRDGADSVTAATGLLDTIARQLRLRDVLSFYPFGVRIRL